MENIDDSENNAKISDSAYSNSCSNSQSRRSHSSKSTHSGSNSSGSSGYGGKPSTGSSDACNQPPEKRFKEGKKKKQTQTEPITSEPPKEVEASPEVLEQNEADMKPNDVSEDVTKSPAAVISPKEQFSENMDVSVMEQSTVQEEVDQAPAPAANTQIVAFGNVPVSCFDGFSCVISMHDGVVMYTTSSVTNAVGFPKEMWIGRSFIDFVHPKDRNTFASQITSGLFTPTSCDHSNSTSTMFCRIRQYRNLGCAGFGVRERNVMYLPFQLNISFKDINNEEEKCIYLVVQAKPIFSVYRTSNEVFTNSTPFVMRHISNGNLEYLDYKSLPFLGYLPQEIINKCILQLYHPDDLLYIRQIYETIVKEGKSERSKTYRMLAQNGDYVKLETEWSSFINPWSKKLEFIVGKHYVMQGPDNPNVFMQPKADNEPNDYEEENSDVKLLKDDILRIMNEVLTKPAETAKQHMSKRYQDLAIFMESLMEDDHKADEELRLDIHEPDERDSVMLGGISPHHDNDSKSGTETPLSYNQLNYNENLQRYFERHEPVPYNYFSLESTDREHIISQGRRLSPMAATNSGDSGDGSSSGSRPNLSPDGSAGSYSILNNRYAKLTETLLNKHNAEMEKELVKKHREARTSTKTERERASNETKQKQKEHLARCNVSRSLTRHKYGEDSQSHGVKRTCHRLDQDSDKDIKCRKSKQSRRNITFNSKNKPRDRSTAVSTWTTPTTTRVNTFAHPMPTMTQPISLINPVAAIPAGMIPIYYVPTAASAAATNNKTEFPASVPYIMYPQPMLNSQFAYSPLNSQVAYPMVGQLAPNSSAVRQSTTEKQFVLPNSNFEQICEPGPSFLKHRGTTHGLTSWRDKKLINKNNTTCTMADQSSSNSSSINANIDNNKAKVKSDREDAVDRTDCESSYSSFYSSFFKTDSGSLEESSDRKNKIDPFPRPQNFDQLYTTYGESEPSTFDKRYCPSRNISGPRRTTTAPWLDQVSVTSELIYKYQVLTRDLNDVLQSDMIKMKSMEQPRLVDEQLGQLYLDLQLEGVAAKLTLEEGITSSGSSAEEASTVCTKKKRKATYSKLVMVYEENAPLPPPDPKETALTSVPESNADASFLPLDKEEGTSLSPPEPENDTPQPPTKSEKDAPSTSHKPEISVPPPPHEPENDTPVPPPEPEYNLN